MSISLYKGAEARNCCYYLLLLNRREWKNEGANEARPTQRRFAMLQIRYCIISTSSELFCRCPMPMPARGKWRNRHHTMALRWRLL